jgi:hypothetical protein
MRRLGRLALLLVVPFVVGCGMGNASVKAPAASSATRAKLQDQHQEPPTPAAARETVENPQYKSWAGFPKGTTIVQRSVTEAIGAAGATTTTKTFTLIDGTEEQAVVAMRVRTKKYDGQEFDDPPENYAHPRLIPLPPGMTKADFDKPSGSLGQGEETVKLGTKEYRTQWREGKGRNEAGEVFTKVWSCDDVPGGLVKSITRIPAIGKTMTIELVEVKVP